MRPFSRRDIRVLLVLVAAQIASCSFAASLHDEWTYSLDETAPLRLHGRPQPIFRKCPCRIGTRSLSLKTNSLDLFVVRREAWEASLWSWRGRQAAVSILRQYTIHDVSVNSAALVRMVRMHPPSLRIQESGEFALLFRYNAETTGENPSTPFTLQSLSRSLDCPIVMDSSSPETTATPTPAPTASQQPDSNRIAGGDLATPASQSHMASLTSPTGSAACTGTLLSARWVLTAAHCQVTTEWRARVGTGRLLIGTVTPIENVYNHHDWVKEIAGLDYDIALVELAEDAPPWSTYVRVNDNGSLPALGSFCRSVGYGIVSEDAAVPNLELRSVDIPTAVQPSCKKIYKGIGVSVKKRVHVCTGYERGGCSFCKGDSGGPILQYDAAGNPVQMGVVSFQMGCAEPGIPGVSVRVSAYVAWMDSVGANFTTASRTISVFTEESPMVSSLEEADDDTNTGGGPGEGFGFGEGEGSDGAGSGGEVSSGAESGGEESDGVGGEVEGGGEHGEDEEIEDEQDVGTGSVGVNANNANERKGLAVSLVVGLSLSAAIVVVIAVAGVVTWNRRDEWRLNASPDGRGDVGRDDAEDGAGVPELEIATMRVWGQDGIEPDPAASESSLSIVVRSRIAIHSARKGDGRAAGPDKT